jgi:hypothetical protein
LSTDTNHTITKLTPPPNQYDNSTSVPLSPLFDANNLKTISNTTPCDYSLNKHKRRKIINSFTKNGNKTLNKNQRQKIYKSIGKQHKSTTHQNIVVNLSNRKLNLIENSVLNKGLNFCLTSNNTKKTISLHQREVLQFIRNLQIKYIFADKESVEKQLKFTGNPNWQPPPEDCSEVIQGYGIFLNKILKNITKRNKIKQNISSKERQALDTLKMDTNILIQKADKGGSITIINTTDYVTKINTMLSDIITYTPVKAVNLTKAKQEANDVIKLLYRNNFIKKQQKKHLVKCIPKMPILYGLPKIHKKDWPLRPIVSQISSPSYKLNKLLDYLLTTAEKEIPNLLQDTTQFLRIIHNTPPVSSNILLFTIDVTSLYTVLPHTMIMDYVIEMYKETLPNWNKYTPDIKPIPCDILSHIISIVLKQTFFSFNSNMYTQNYGITMGAPSSVKLANITLFKHLEKTLQRFTGNTPYLQLRLIDDIFGLYNGTEDELQAWVNFLNNSHPSIKFTVEISTTQLPFLDTLVYLDNNIVKTKLYKKPTDNKQYLLFNSEHPFHVKKSIPYAQAIRYKRIIADNEELHRELNKLKHNFTTRLYPISAINTALEKIEKLDRNHLLTYKNKTTKKFKATPLVLTYCNALVSNPKLNIHKVIAESWDQLIKCDDAFNQIDPPKIVFKRCETINNILVSTTFPPRRWTFKNNGFKSPILNPIIYNKTNTLHNYFKINKFPDKCKPCGKPRCASCSIINMTNQFTSTTHGKTRRLKHNVDCGSQDIIYLITCKICKIQYVGETRCSLRKRFSHHRSCVKLNNENNKTPISIHFNSIGHDLSHMEVIPIEQLSENNDMYRRARETFWQLTLGTIFPYGLNHFPVQQEDLFVNLQIESPIDLVTFWNLFCLDKQNN